jgi:hypothetical protein
MQKLMCRLGLHGETVVSYRRNALGRNAPEVDYSGIPEDAQTFCVHKENFIREFREKLTTCTRCDKTLRVESDHVRGLFVWEEKIWISADGKVLRGRPKFTETLFIMEDPNGIETSN